MTTLGDYLLAVFCLAALLIGYGALEASKKKCSQQDEINRQEYQRRNDLKGGSK